MFHNVMRLMQNYQRLSLKFNVKLAWNESNEIQIRESFRIEFQQNRLKGL